MPCDCCEKARLGPMYAVHCPSCLHCGARLIWAIQRLPIAREAKIGRCRAVLQDWLQYDHSEAEIRRLAKLEAMPLAPPLSTALSTGPGKRWG